ncbi:MAG TPA: prolyl oligopeptidase family serine peptidase [Cytophagaceae bacterium]
MKEPNCTIYLYKTLNTPGELIDSKHYHTISREQFLGIVKTFGRGSLAQRIKYDVAVYKLSYTTNFLNKIILCSGLVYLPIAKEAVPLMSFHHGTTFRKSEAPSVVDGFSGLEFFASVGSVCFRPDYIGYGDSEDSFHPYYDQESSANCVKDFIVAGLKFLTEQKTAHTNQLILAGYSEGGYITLATQKHLEASPIPGLKLAAVAAGAGGYDLKGMLSTLSTGTSHIYPAYVAFLITSYEKVYNWNKPLDYYFNKSYAIQLPELLNGSHDSIYINSRLTGDLSKLFNPKFYNNLKGSGELEFKKALVMNSLINWSPQAPLRLYHGTNDEIIPYVNSETTLSSLKDNKQIELIPIRGGNHINSLVPMLESFIAWLGKLKIL